MIYRSVLLVIVSLFFTTSCGKHNPIKPERVKIRFGGKSNQNLASLVQKTTACNPLRPSEPTCNNDINCAGVFVYYPEDDFPGDASCTNVDNVTQTFHEVSEVIQLAAGTGILEMDIKVGLFRRFILFGYKSDTDCSGEVGQGDNSAPYFLGYVDADIEETTTDIALVANPFNANDKVTQCTGGLFDYTSGPIDNGANLQFTADYSASGNSVDVSWTPFTDDNLSDHRLYTYTDAACLTGEIDHGLTGSTSSTNNTVINGLADGQYFAVVEALSSLGTSTISSCSTDSIIVDNIDPVPSPTDANFTFINATNTTGNNLDVSWNPFVDANAIADYRILIFSNITCTSQVLDTGYLGSNSTANNTNINGLADGTYYAKVEGKDVAGNTGLSSCSADSIVVDTTGPTDNVANLQFTLDYTNNGSGIAVTWTAFTDPLLALTDHKIRTYTDASCIGGEMDHGLTGSSANSAIINGIASQGPYYATVEAFDGIGNSTLSACSTDFITVDFQVPAPAPTDAHFTFTNPTNATGNNVDVSWDPFTDNNAMADYRIKIFSDNTCITEVLDTGYLGSNSTANNTNINGLADGTYYAVVEGKDVAGNTALSTCSIDSIIISSVVTQTCGGGHLYTHGFGQGDRSSSGIILAGTITGGAQLIDGFKTVTDGFNLVGDEVVNNYIEFQFPTAVCMEEFNWIIRDCYNSGGGCAADFIGDFKLEGSNDGVNFTVLKSGHNFGSANGLYNVTNHIFPIEPAEINNAYTHFRMETLQAGGAANMNQVEIEFKLADPI